MKKVMSYAITMAVFALLLSSCTVVRQGEVGVKRTFGKYADRPYMEGLKVYNPFTSTIVKVPVQTENMEVSLNLPSREGLNIRAEISILYNIQSTQAPDLLRNIGGNYENNVILPVFRSAVADVSARFYAKDMHTGERGTIEGAIQQQMTKLLDGRGIIIEAVLIKSIQLPPNLARAIEEKLEAEQRALRMEFVLQEERREAERKRIQAEGVRDAQNIISQGLDPQVLQFKSIEAFLELAKSPNTKVIISDGDLPVLLGPEGTEAVPSNTGLRR
ncbi:MAG: prohibitin family protein [Phaeodactylibacter sp.]|nr:prohibitin family protein [Phaeodactylibacter sp.]MCB9265807.1 prohibitin family protein [Lewinellaceae bacterium]MCB9290960.1 prohibitin family protein [Lewinellaceae bacterium]